MGGFKTAVLLASALASAPVFGAEINFSPPVSAMPEPADAAAGGYNPVVRGAPIRLVTPRGSRGRVGVAAISDIEPMPLGLLRPVGKKVTLPSQPDAVTTATATPPPATPVASMSAAPPPDGFTETRVRRLLVAEGFSGIQELYQDDAGVWHGMAMPPNGRATAFEVSSDGTFTTKPVLTAVGYAALSGPVSR